VIREYVESTDRPVVLRADERASIPAGVAWIPVTHAWPEPAPPQGRTLPGLDLDLRMEASR